MVWRADDPQGNEAGKVLWELVPYTRGFGLDVGCGPHKAFPHFIGVDNKADTKLFGTPMNPDLVVGDATKLIMFADSSMDFVFSSHMLEHVEDYKACLKEWWRLIKVGGHLCLYLPHKDFYPNRGQEGANPDHKHDFVPQDIVEAMLEIGAWDLLRNEDRNEAQEYSFYQVYRKRSGGEPCTYPYREPKPPKRAAVVRYGAWGDALQAASVLVGLKKQGFHVSLYTTPRAWEVLREDPNVDEVILQDTDQVPNAALDHFWKNEKAKYERWVNLSESVEGQWLTLNDRPYTKTWPQSVREKYLDTNYLEFAHELAEVPYRRPDIHFHPTQEEFKWAANTKHDLDAWPLILWVLSGSSIHKVWPHIDQIFARVLLSYPKAKIVTCGGERERVLDEPWRLEPRIVRTAGTWSIRQTLTMAQISDLVVGPETGVLNSVCAEKMPKIVFLSHSSHNNLTRDWKNTFALFSKTTPCYPCHKMHYGWDTCNRNNEEEEYWGGTAQCQVDIPPEACWIALQRALRSIGLSPNNPIGKLGVSNVPATATA